MLFKTGRDPAVELVSEYPPAFDPKIMLTSNYSEFNIQYSDLSQRLNTFVHPHEQKLLRSYVLWHKAQLATSKCFGSKCSFIGPEI